MSKSKRAPIDYTPQFAEGIFRPKEIVADELGDLEKGGVEERKSTDVPVHARTHARTSRGSARSDTVLIDDLYRDLQQKQRLASSTFRFQPSELEELDAVTTELARAGITKLSKNDVVRLAVNWLLSDYRHQGNKSILTRVLQRT
jgi:hypothetical protein